jgi:AcrR family transcriptional regulator
MVRLVGSEGYESVTVRKLAATAHVSTGTFYALFSGTDECFLGVHKALVDKARERIARTRSPCLNRREQATLALRAMIDALTDDPAPARIMVMEVFVGGPAALGPAREGEARLGIGLKESLDRRGERMPVLVATWITAGIFHWVRSTLGFKLRSPSGRSSKEMVEWGMRVVTDGPWSDTERRRCPAEAGGESSLKESRESRGGDDDELLVAAAKRLALANGYRRLTMAGISGAAGLTTAAFKRHFGSVETVYLEVVRRLAATLFGVPAIDLKDRPPPCGPDVAALCRRVAADPATARIALIGNLEVGREGLGCTRALISRVATACDMGRRDGSEFAGPTVEAAVAALWAVLAGELTRDEVRHLPATAQTLTRLFSLAVPMPTSGSAPS